MRTIGAISSRSSRIAAFSNSARSSGSATARPQAEVSATNVASPLNSSRASTCRLLLVRGQMLDLGERGAIQTVRITEPLREQVQPCCSLILGESYRLGRRNRAGGNMLHVIERSVHAGQPRRPSPACASGGRPAPR